MWTKLRAMLSFKMITMGCQTPMSRILLKMLPMLLKSAGTKSNRKWAHVEKVYKDLCNKEEYVQIQCKTYLEEQQSAKTS